MTKRQSPKILFENAVCYDVVDEVDFSWRNSRESLFSQQWRIIVVRFFRQRRNSLLLTLSACLMTCCFRRARLEELLEWQSPPGSVQFSRWCRFISCIARGPSNSSRLLCFQRVPHLRDYWCFQRLHNLIFYLAEPRRSRRNILHFLSLTIYAASFPRFSLVCNTYMHLQTPLHDCKRLDL